MKRALKWLAVVVLLLALAAGAVLYLAFGRNLPIVDGQMLTPGVETVKEGLVSAFLLEAAPGKVALIDCGSDAKGQALLAALQRRGLSPSSVMAIFLTHGHSDHLAGCGLFPDAQVYALQEELPLLADKVRVTHPLRDGEVTGVGLLRVETFATPGHTPGSAVYLAGGVLYFGDSAAGSKEGTLMPAVRLFSDDPGQNVASLRALAARLKPRAQEVRVLAFAHSGPLNGLQPLTSFAAQ